MSETLPTIEQIQFTDLLKGDVIHVTTGTGESLFQYKFTVTDTSEGITGVIEETLPDGREGGAGVFILQGCGRWTTQRENPVQKQPRAFTPYYDNLVLGSFMFGALPEAAGGGRMVFDKPGQEISQLRLQQS